MADNHAARAGVTDLVSRCTRAMAANDWVLAHQHVVAGIRQVNELATHDPDERDASVLGGFHYNAALVLDRLTDAQYARSDRRSAWDGRSRSDAAVHCAKRAVECYLRSDPSLGDSTRVKAALRWTGRRRPAVADRIAHTADARARLVRLLAAHGSGDPSLVQEHGIAALNTYGVLVEARGTMRTQSDLHRIADQVLPALQRVGLLP